MLTKGQLLLLIVQYLTKHLSKIRWTLFVEYATIFNRQKGTYCCRELRHYQFNAQILLHEILRSGVRTKWLRFSTNHIQCKRGDVLSPSVRRSLSLYEGEFIVYNKTISVFRKLEIIVPFIINVVVFNFLDKKFFLTMYIFLFSISVKYQDCMQSCVKSNPKNGNDLLINPEFIQFLSERMSYFCSRYNCV